MLLDHPFEVVTTAADGRVLQVLAGADTWFTVAQVWHLSGVRSRDQVRKVLARLAATGILDTEQVTTSFRYRLNRDHLAASAIIDISELKRRLVERLHLELNRWTTELVFASLFGSAARGDMHDRSDIDILLVWRAEGESPSAAVQEAAAAGLEAKVLRWTGNPTNVLNLSVADVLRSGETDALANIKREGIPVFGEPTWLYRAFR